MFQFYVRNPVILAYIQGYSGFIKRYKELQNNEKNTICLPRQYLPQHHGPVRHAVFSGQAWSE